MKGKKTLEFVLAPLSPKLPTFLFGLWLEQFMPEFVPGGLTKNGFYASIILYMEIIYAELHEQKTSFRLCIS